MTQLGIRFLCNCIHMYNNMSIIETDTEGFLTCPTHHVRRYGWKSLPPRHHKAFPFDEDDPQYVTRLDYRFMFKPLEAERHVLSAILEAKA